MSGPPKAIEPPEPGWPNEPGPAIGIGGQARQKPRDMVKERPAGMSRPAGTPYIVVLSVRISVMVVTVAGVSRRTLSTSLTVAAYIRVRRVRVGDHVRGRELRRAPSARPRG
ncbi:hypothetical protein [Amycolatopsis sp. MEPSY49]|uniref:hypothetical protein n=1 Tax=Amycolatopsis sp. MEPSY49 TaxID=3151600 RepID=UPI003EF5C383